MTSNLIAETPKPDPESQSMKSLLLCGACKEILFDPLTLPCGMSVCSTCLRLPKLSEKAALLKERLEESMIATCGTNTPTSPSTLEMRAEFLESLLRTYVCPVKTCRKRHQYRNEKVDRALSTMIERLFPKQMVAYQIVKAVEKEMKEGKSRTFVSGEESPTTIQELDDAVSPMSDEFYEQALSKLSTALENAPELQLPYLVRAKVYCEIKRYDEAFTDAAAAKELNAENRRGIVTERLIELRRRKQSPGSSPNNKREKETGGKHSRSQESRKQSEKAANDLTIPSPISYLSQNESDVECHVCLNVFTDPVTSPCGHSFCRTCLRSSLVHSHRCPLCRAPLPSDGYFEKRPSNLTLKTLLDISGKVGEGQPNPAHAQINPRITIPIFVCSLILPGTSQSFHLFEPRYRVMVKQCVDENKPFGICLPSREDEEHMEFGTMVDIRHCEAIRVDYATTSIGRLPRYVIETESLYRFRVLERSQTDDGLHMAVVERIDDLDPEDDPRYNSGAVWDPLNLASDYLKARSFVSALFESLSPTARRHFQAQHRPVPDDPADFTFWLANILPIDPYQKYEFLPLQNVESRMSILAKWIDRVAPPRI
ncbi:hypothetical protein HDU76_000039 [Blyttiomyces sp. JEL0837]|nr:hypothetical protein HDU76_000039 [Blyttiomyces sp. JEL0837]